MSDGETPKTDHILQLRLRTGDVADIGGDLHVAYFEAERSWAQKLRDGGFSEAWIERIKHIVLAERGANWRSNLGANPVTCRHNVVEHDNDLGLYFCVSCEQEVNAEKWFKLDHYYDHQLKLFSRGSRSSKRY